MEIPSDLRGGAEEIVSHQTGHERMEDTTLRERVRVGRNRTCFEREAPKPRRGVTRG